MEQILIGCLSSIRGIQEALRIRPRSLVPTTRLTRGP